MGKVCEWKWKECVSQQQARVSHFSWSVCIALHPPEAKLKFSKPFINSIIAEERWISITTEIANIYCLRTVWCFVPQNQEHSWLLMPKNWISYGYPLLLLMNISDWKDKKCTGYLKRSKRTLSFSLQENHSVLLPFLLSGNHVFGIPGSKAVFCTWLHQPGSIQYWVALTVRHARGFSFDKGKERNDTGLRLCGKLVWYWQSWFLWKAKQRICVQTLLKNRKCWLVVTED